MSEQTTRPPSLPKRYRASSAPSRKKRTLVRFLLLGDARGNPLRDPRQGRFERSPSRTIHAANVAPGSQFRNAGARRYEIELCARTHGPISFRDRWFAIRLFGRHAAVNRARRGLGRPETFTFLGFTLICGKSRRGRFLLKRKTRRDRMRAKLQEIKEALLRQRHQPIPKQGDWLRQVVTGFFAYHAVPTNGPAISAFRYRVVTFWHKALRRRSQKDKMPWARMKKLADDWLPMPRILHPWPSERFAVKHPRWEPDARIGHVRFCAGGAQK